MKRAQVVTALLAAGAVAAAGGSLWMRHAGGGRRRAGATAAWQLDAAWVVAGRVVDRLGRPMAGARVLAGAPAGDGGAWTVAVTDDEGRYVLRLGGGAVSRLRVEAEGFVPEELGGVEPPQAGLEFTLARRLALEGLVRVRGQAAADAEVTIAGASGTRTAKSGPDGAFSFAGLAEGRYALRAVRAGEAAYLDGVVVAAGDGGHRRRHRRAAAGDHGRGQAARSRRARHRRRRGDPVGGRRCAAAARLHHRRRG